MIKFFFIILTLFLYQNTSFSKTIEKDHFNHRYLSNYFSAMLSFNNQDNDKTVKFLDLNKKLINKTDTSYKKYILSLINEGKINKAIKFLKRSQQNNILDFFEANLLLYSNAIIKKDFIEAKKYVTNIKKFKDKGTFEQIISQTIESYNYLFLNRKIPQTNNNLGKLSLVNKAFQECYLGTGKDENYFLNLINSEDGDYSRYIYFYLNNLINSKDYITAKNLALTINEVESNLLILQSKKWIQKKEYEKFSNYFSCKSESDIIAEFFFIIANLYSSQEEYDKSNYYLSISNYLNVKFFF